MGTPNREPQEYSRILIEHKDPGRYIPFIFLLYSWGFPVWVTIRVPLIKLLRGSSQAEWNRHEPSTCSREIPYYGAQDRILLKTTPKRALIFRYRSAEEERINP